MLRTDSNNNFTIKKDKIQLSTYLLALYLFILPLDFIDIGIGSILKIYSVIVILITVLDNMMNFKINIHIVFVMVLFFTLSYASSGYALQKYLPISRAESLLLNYAFIIICASSKKNEEELSILAKALALSGWFAVGLMLYFRGDLYGRLIVEVDGQRQDPNYMCGFLLFSIVYYLNLIFNSNKKTWASISVVTMIVIVFFTGSRGGAIAVAFVILCFYIIGSNFKNKIRNGFLIIVVGIVVVFVVNKYVSQDILLRYTIEYNEVNQGAGRIELWESAIYNYKNFGIFNKLFGAGAGTIRMFTVNVAHNLWLETLLELGIIGACVLIVMYLIFIRYGFKIKNKVYLTTLLGYVTMTMSLSLYTYKPIFTIFMLIAMYYKREYLDEGKK